MSTFDGHLLEYPFVSLDRFNSTNLNSTVYFLSHCHKDHIEGLLDDEFLRRLQDGTCNKVRLYTSETSRNLISCDPCMNHLIDYVIGIPVNQPFTVTVPNLNDNEETLTVTLISAGHCVGSVMFLFEGKEGTVLYTGDFRLTSEQLSKVPCLHYNNKMRHLKSVYVDTTFCSPNMPCLPTRTQTKDCLIKIIQRWISRGDNHVVHLKCKGKYGYEYIMKGVAKYFNTKIHVNENRLLMYSKLPYMLEHFTTHASSTQIHCCYYGYKSNTSTNTLPCGLEYLKGTRVNMITIIPSTLFFANNKIPETGMKHIPSQKTWRVVHSMHASYSEIRDVICYLQPENVYPFVPPFDCQDILVAYQRLQDLCKKVKRDSAILNKPRLDLTWKREGWEKALKTPTISAKGSPSRVLLSPPPMCRKRKSIESEVSIKIRLNTSPEIVTCKDPRRQIIGRRFSEPVYTNICTKVDGSGLTNVVDGSGLTNVVRRVSEGFLSDQTKGQLLESSLSMLADSQLELVDSGTERSSPCKTRTGSKVDIINISSDDSDRTLSDYFSSLPNSQSP